MRVAAEALDGFDYFSVLHFYDGFTQLVAYPQCVIGLDVHSRRPADTRCPLFKELSLLIENLDSPVCAIRNDDTASRIHQDDMWQIELTGPFSFRSSDDRDELAVLIESHNPGVLITIGDIDVAIG